jgi:hypothetical protein
MKSWRFAAVVALALSGTLALSSTAGAARNEPRGKGWLHLGGYVCASGAVPAGNYRSILIQGVCTMPSGHINISDDLTLAPGALLDAVTPGDPTSGTAAVPATVMVGGNVWVLKGAALLLGCSPNISCAPPAAGITFDQIGGNLTAFGAQAVVLHDVAVKGNISITGGGGGSVAASCAAQSPSDPTNAALEPWSEDAALDFTPVYTDFEDGSVAGNLHVVGLDTCWMGALRNWVDGSAYFANNTFGDPDAMEIGNNLIWGNLGCWNNSPAPQFGDSTGAPDVVNRFGLGQCSFKVVLSNPAAEAIASNMQTGVGVNEHFVVSMHSLKTYTGSLSTTSVGTLPGYPLTTSSGDSIFADLNDISLGGTGITGTADYSGGAPGQAPGQAELGSTTTGGWSHFITYNACASCSFDGQTGALSFRTYGATWPTGGHTQGVFLITSSGAVLPTSTSPVPGLALLVGWGTFSGTGTSVNLVEHLGFG